MFKKLDKQAFLLSLVLFILVGVGVYINLAKQWAVDRSKIPEKVELNKGFQRWITNLKNDKVDISADDFRLLEENEIYNTKWITVHSLDEEGIKDTFENIIDLHKNTANSNEKKIIFSPSGKQFIDYRNEDRDGYKINEVHYYGLRDDKILDARILDCSVRANCYFDRAYFLDNDVFVISEVSRNINKKDTTSIECSRETICTYTVKLHIIDLNRNSRLVYESKPFDVVINKLIPQL